MSPADWEMPSGDIMRRRRALWLWAWGPGPVVGDAALSWPSRRPPWTLGAGWPRKGLFPCRTISSPFTTGWALLPALTCLSFCSVFSPFPWSSGCLSLAFSISSISSDLLQRYPKYLETTHYLCKNVLVRLRPPKRETLILTDAINQGSIHFLLTWLRCEVSAVSVTGASQAENFR